MIVVIGGIKGGTGKSTIASNLAVLRSDDGKKVLLVDADEQKSVSDWAQHRQARGIPTPWTTTSLSGRLLRTEVMKMKQDYDDVVIDTGGRDTTSQRSALSIADVLLVPFQPRSFDTWTVEQVQNVLEDTWINNPKLRPFAVINRADATGNDNKDAENIIREKGKFIHFATSLGNRKSFANAAAEGLAVHELAQEDKKAKGEMFGIYIVLFAIDYGQVSDSYVEFRQQSFARKIEMDAKYNIS